MEVEEGAIVLVDEGVGFLEEDFEVGGGGGGADVDGFDDFAAFFVANLDAGGARGGFELADVCH